EPHALNLPTPAILRTRPVMPMAAAVALASASRQHPRQAHGRDVVRAVPASSTSAGHRDPTQCLAHHLSPFALARRSLTARGRRGEVGVRLCRMYVKTICTPVARR